MIYVPKIYEYGKYCVKFSIPLDTYFRDGKLPLYVIFTESLNVPYIGIVHTDGTIMRYGCNCDCEVTFDELMYSLIHYKNKL